MISRRNIRVKVMQTLYVYATAESTDKPMDPQRILKNHFNQSRSLLAYLIQSVIEVARYAEKDAHKRSKKYIPSAKDLNVNVKLAGSGLLWQILDDPEYKSLIKNEKSDLLIEEDFTKKIYDKLTQTREYLHYIGIQQQSKQEDKKIFDYIFSELLLENEDFIAAIEEQFSNWDDDGEMISQLAIQYLHKPGSFNFYKIISGDKEQFANSLLETVIDKEDFLLEIITPKLKNWDPERIALLDMIIMKMGVSEFLYFDTIPPKVTINEYIDLAKEYSTAQSGHFINGILDNIHKELVENGKMKKTVYKKA